MSVWDTLNEEVRAYREKRAIQTRFLGQLLAAMYRLTDSEEKPMTFEEVVMRFRKELSAGDDHLWEVFTRSFCESCDADGLDCSWLLED